MNKGIPPERLKELRKVCALVTEKSSLEMQDMAWVITELLDEIERLREFEFKYEGLCK